MEISRSFFSGIPPFTQNIYLTRTKTSIRYAKENDREKRDRKKGKRRDIEREGEIREIE